MDGLEPVAIISATNDTPDPADLAWAFPDVEPGMTPFGGRIVVQLRRRSEEHTSELQSH